MSEKKRWFIAYSFNFWIPVSWEGWALLSGQLLAVALIFWNNDIFTNGDRPFTLSDGWPMIIELVVLIGGTFWITRGHVDKRY